MTKAARSAAAVLVCLLTLRAAECRAADMSAAQAGSRIGQALSAAKLCPGARATAKITALAKSYGETNPAVIKTEADKIVASWDKALGCVESNPEIKLYTGCRKTKILSCNSAWGEIGPEGTELPGLLDFAAPPLQDDD